MNKKGYYGYNFNQAFLTAVILGGLIVILNMFGVFNQGQIVEVPQNPIDSVTELQRNYDTLRGINQELRELVDWDFYAENEELQKKLDKSIDTGDLILLSVMLFALGILLGIIFKDLHNKRKKRKKRK